MKLNYILSSYALFQLAERHVERLPVCYWNGVVSNFQFGVWLIIKEKSWIMKVEQIFLWLMIMLRLTENKYINICTNELTILITIRSDLSIPYISVSLSLLLLDISLKWIDGDYRRSQWSDLSSRRMIHLRITINFFWVITSDLFLCA